MGNKSQIHGCLSVSAARETVPQPIKQSLGRSLEIVSASVMKDSSLEVGYRNPRASDTLGFLLVSLKLCVAL